MGKKYLKVGSNYENNVFINCPFDEDYKPLLKILLFAIKSVGLTPRLALETYDSGVVRLNKIKGLIEESKYSIHDLSKVKAKKDEYYRFNMPFELGYDLGCKTFSNMNNFKDKKYLIFETEQYSTQKALSDLSFADCKCHNGDKEDIIHETRNWFVENGFKKIRSASQINADYEDFYFNLLENKSKEGFTEKDIDKISIAEFIIFIDEYLDD